MKKHDYVSDDWIAWIQKCYQDKTDFQSMMDILLETFDQDVIDPWVKNIWFSVNDRNFSWMRRDLTIVNGVRVEYLNVTPVVAVLHNILSENECSQIIESYRNDNRLTRASVHKKDTETGLHGPVVHRSRTNSAMFIELDENPIITLLEERISNVTGIPIENGELSQILYYQLNQEYTPHDDFLWDQDLNSRVPEWGQRIATVVTYLNDVKQGGATHFPNLDITVPARAGTAVYFEYTNSRGASTTKCHHAGMPVIDGEKWAVSKWFRMKPTYHKIIVGN